MSHETPFERLGRELEAAAARQVSSTAARAPRRRRWLRRTLGIWSVVLGVSAGAAAWAATSLLSAGAPVPFKRGAPVAGRAQGAPIPRTVKLLVEDVADPAGGPPWGLRYWETDRKYACIQVGRVYDGRLGQITGDVFHELRLGEARGQLGGCFLLDGSGHAFVAIHIDANRGAQPPSCTPGVNIGTARGPHGQQIRCQALPRTIDFGLRGPNAARVDYTADRKARSATPAGGVGAYLVVQKRVKPVVREVGYHHRDPKLNVRVPVEPYLALTPASQVITQVAYASGTCKVHVTSSDLGACPAQAGLVPIQQPAVGDVRTPVRAFAAPDGRGIRVRFTARQAVLDARSAYDIEVHSAGVRGYVVQTYSRNVSAGDPVRTTVDLYNRRRGAYRIVVRYRTVQPRPPVLGTGRSRGVLVGEKRVNVP